jgi:hypothetical protein
MLSKLIDARDDKVSDQQEYHQAPLTTKPISETMEHHSKSRVQACSTRSVAAECDRRAFANFKQHRYLTSREQNAIRRFAIAFSYFVESRAGIV